METARFTSGRVTSGLVGVGMALLTAAIVYVSFFVTEDQFLHTRIRRGGGIMKLIEQTIGWNAFVALMLAFGAWAAVYAVVSFWKALDGTPDVTAHPDGLTFHPAVRRSPAHYDDLSHWSLEWVQGNPVLWLHFHESYWSLQGLFKRKTVKLEGSKEDLEPLFQYFSNHPQMNPKFIG